MTEGGKPSGYLAKFGEKLIQRGYDIIPIRRGHKAPPGDNWQKTKATPKLLREWLDGPQKRSGVGVLTRRTPMVDLDILDEEVALAMERFVQERFGPAPVRIGMAPKRGLVFRTDEPFAKINSPTFEDEWGDPNAATSGSGKPVGHLRKVEILGDGQQFVAYHIHPDTGQPYRWIDKGIASIPWEDLPVLTHDDGLAIVAEFVRLAEERGWEVKKEARALARPTATRVGKIDDDDPFAADADRVEDLDDEQIREMLLRVPGASDYDTWLQIGMALYHQFDGDQAGLDLWHEWSEEAHNYEAEALNDKWATFDISDKGRAPVTARLIIKLAVEYEKEVKEESFREFKTALEEAASVEEMQKVFPRIKKIELDVVQRMQLVALVQKRFKKLTDAAMPIGTARSLIAYERPKNTDVPRWAESWVYVGHTASFYNMTRRTEVSTKAFDHMFNRYMLTPVQVLEGQSVPETPASAFVLNNLQIPVVHNLMYMPGEEEVFSYQGRAFVNTYSDHGVPEVPNKLNKAEREAVEMIDRHFEHLFPVERDRRILKDALGWIVQNPGKRLNWGILLQGAEGDGKTFFAHVLAAALGQDNVNNLQAQAMEEKYNSWAEGSQVVFFEEIKLHGHNRYDVINKVKPLLTNFMVPIRRMNTNIYQAINTVTYILTTNHRDALPLDDNDSRYFILFSRFQTKRALRKFLETDPTYYDRLYATLDHPGAIRKWLLSLKFSPEFNPLRRAADSQAKKEMISYAKTEEAEVIEDLIDNSPRWDISSTILDATSLVEELFEQDITPPQTRSMNQMLLALGFTRLGRIRIGGRSGSMRLIWSREPDKFRDELGDLNTDAVRAYLETDL